MERQIKVLDQPETYILINSNLSDEEIRSNWLEKHSMLYTLHKPLSQEQKRRENISIREGKTFYRSRYK